MAMLVTRSLSSTLTAHPHLRVVHNTPQALGDYATLRKVLIAQPLTIAIASSEALPKTFTDLLAELIGPTLASLFLSWPLDRVSSRNPPIRNP